MKKKYLYILAVLFILGCDSLFESLQKKTLPEAKKNFQTKLVEKVAVVQEVEAPLVELLNLVSYQSSVGELSAYISLPLEMDKEHPAIIWIFGGFSNSIGSTAWNPGPRDNDQSASAFRKKGIVMMYPSFRGGNSNPGYIEGLYGEVDDIIAAYEYLAAQLFVDANRIYLGGHSTGGTLALLVAESTDKFRCIFSLGPVGDIRAYGEEYFYFDTSNLKEWELRSPAYFLHSIITPTFIFEGTEGNIESLRNMKNSTRNTNIKFFEIKEADHFSIIAPLTEFLADKINRDQDPDGNINIMVI